ncbi:MAG: alanyl-tRNA editing protein [Ruminococcaceae bacterium]|nr:alanyl-tRNA editing protein [Oscillospiraceae bacterium]
MKTKQLYYEDSGIKEFTACVLSCTQYGDSFCVVLDKTAFFPEGGGQCADVGTIGDANVLDVQIENDEIVHYVDREVSDEVLCKLDWMTRFTRMQNHTAEHIISGIIHNTFGLDNIGFHLSNESITCDYNGDLNWEQLKEIEVLANKYVFESIPVEISSPTNLENLEYRSKLDLAEGVRLVTISGVDCCACCAPHVKHTGEIGLIKIVNFERAHHGTRLHLRCGFLALADYDEKQDNILRICELLSARQYETADCVEQLQRANSQLKFDMGKASERLAEMKLQTIDKTTENLVVELDNANKEALLTLANGGKEKTTGLFVALTKQDDGYRYMITSGTSLPLSKIAKDINLCLNGKGGGKDDMIQGSFETTKEIIDEFFRNFTPNV